MLDDFKFLGEDKAYEIVVKNTNKLADMCDIVEVIIDTGGIPFSPRVKSDDGKTYLDCPAVVTELVYTKAANWYGDPLPYYIEERIATELYGDIVLKIIKTKLEKNGVVKWQHRFFVEKSYFAQITSFISLRTSLSGQ